MSAKLDNLSKIILATGAINYLAVSLDSVNEQIKMIPDKEGTFEHGIQARDNLLFETWGKLGDIMQDLGNLINGQDCLTPIDIRVTKEAFNVVIHGKDNVNK